MEKQATMTVWCSDSHKVSRIYEESENAFNITTMTKPDLDMTSHDWVAVGEATITYKLRPAYETVPEQVEALKAMKKKAQAVAQAKFDEIDQMIQELLCLPAPKAEGDFE